MPEIIVQKSTTRLVDLLAETKLAPSKGEARRLIEGGGIRIGDDKIGDIGYEIPSDLVESGFVLHKGKKVHVRIKFC